MGALPTSKKLINLRDGWIDAILRHYRVVLLLAVLMTVFASWLASQLRIDSDLRQLLPDDHPVIESLEDVEASFGALGSVNLVIKGGDAKQRHRFAETVASELQGHPLLSGVEYELPIEYFEERALYYLSDTDMNELRERVSAWQHYELCSAQESLCIDKPDPLAREKLRDFVQSRQRAARARTGFGRYVESEKHQAQVVFIHPNGPSSDLEFATAVSQQMRVELEKIYARADGWDKNVLTYNLVGPYIAKSDEQVSVRRDMVVSGAVGLLGVIVVIFVVFRSWRAVFTLLIPLIAGVAWSLAAAQLLLGHLNTMTSLIASVVMGLGIDAGIHFLSHARRERMHYDSKEAIRRAFRRLIAPLLVASTTTLGCFLIMASSDFPAFHEFGMIAASGVFLCLLSMVSMFPALLCWVGVKVPKQGPRMAIRGGIGRLIVRHPGVFFACVVGLSLLAMPSVYRMSKSGFEYNGRLLQSRAARERTEADVFLISKIFGKDIHAGILTVEDYDTMASIYADAKVVHSKRASMGQSVIAELMAVPELLPPAEIDPSKRRRDIAELAESFTEPVWARLEGRELEPDGERAVIPPESESDIPDDELDDAFEDVEVDLPGTADDADALEDDEDAFEDVEVDIPGQHDADAPTDAPEPDVNDSDAPDDPTADSEQLNGERDESEPVLSPEETQTLRKMLAAQPFGVEDLPPRLLQKFRGEDGRWAILAYPNFDAANIKEAVEFIEETKLYGEAKAGRVYVGESTVYASMFMLMRDEWPVIFGMSVMLIASFVFWQLRSIGATVLTLVPLGLSLWWLLGLMGATGIRLSLFNVPILPALLGIGVDNAIYLVAGIRDAQDIPDGTERAVNETGRAIWAATATTSVGFASFLVADSGGLRGIGLVAVIGILMSAASAILVLPTLTVLARRRRLRGPRRES